MKIRSAIEAMLEYVRGHTGLQAEIDTWRTNLGQNSTMRAYTAMTKPERPIAPSVASFLMEQVWIEVSANASVGDNEEFGLYIIAHDHPGLDEQMLEDKNTGIAQATCRINYIAAGGAQSAFLRPFLFRNGFIHRLL